MKLRTAGALVVLCVVALATVNRPLAQADLPTAKPESVGVSSKRLERVKAYIQDYIDTNQIAGAVTLIARKGKVVHHEAQGWRYKEENQPMQKDTIFTLMSMTKPIASAALMMLWEEGKFMLDDPIWKFLPS
jgi:CubicO group peptidase (beta-lactamase class C family)